MLIYMNSNDPAISGYYNRLRGEIAVVLRDVDIIWSKLEKGKNDESIREELEQLKVMTEKNKKEINHELIKSLHREEITANRCTSIMNDIHYTFSITHNLIAIWLTMIAVYDEVPVSAERETELDDVAFNYDIVTMSHNKAEP